MEKVDFSSRRRHTNLAFASLMVSFAIALTGCTLCQDCGDLEYPTYGGAWQRTRRDSGRVGSIFDPAGARTATLSERDSDREDSSFRTDAPAGSGLPAGDAEGRMDDPKNDSAGSEKEKSPSDRSKDLDQLRELDLNDINVMDSELEPPDA